MNGFGWLVRREFWENRAILIVPAVIGGILTLAALFGRVEFSRVEFGRFSPVDSGASGGFVLFAFSMTFFVVMNIYSSWYLLDCIYAERKDRSVLFWKSLPVSDTATVLAKLFTGLIAIPLVYFIAADLTTLLTAFVVSMRAHNAWVSALWQPDAWLELQAVWLYLIVTTAIWYLPLAGWFIVVSAWARRAVLLWSVLPLCALVLVEHWFFGTWTIGREIATRLFGYMTAAFHGPATGPAWGSMSDLAGPAGGLWSLFDAVGFFSNPRTWAGLAVGAALVAGAIQLRWRRTET